MKHMEIKGLKFIHEASVRQFQKIYISKIGVLEKEEEGEVIFEERIAGNVFQFDKNYKDTKSGY